MTDWKICIATYREKSFVSTLSGTVAAEPLNIIIDSFDETFHTDIPTFQVNNDYVMDTIKIS